MGSLGWIVVSSALLLGCGKQAAPRLDGEINISLGDCAPTTVAFVSGPRPQPFEPAELEPAARAALAAVADETPAIPDLDSDTPRPPEEDTPEGGAFASLTGTGDISEGFDDSNIYGGLLGNEAGEMNGGFGFDKTGFGPGSGGTGWGTIGARRYGTIGHGSGTGHGGATRDGRSASVPTISIGQPNAQGDLNKAIIRRYVKRNIQKIQYCYEKALLARPTLSGTVSVEFFITPAGKVATAKASGMDDEVGSCVANVIKYIEFPKPNGGGGVQVRYPFTFRPADDATPSPPTIANNDPPPADGEDESGGTGTAMALDAGKMGAKDGGRKEIYPDYRAGARSPLRAVHKELVDCFRVQTKRHGVAVFDIATNSIDAHGIDHPGFKACVGKLAKKIAFTDKAPLRCSVAFGPTPVGEAPGLDITAKEILFVGTKISEPAAVIASDLEFKIDSVHKATLARKKAMVESKAPVTLHGPLIIRPLDATPMKAVTKAIYSVHAADDEAVLAAQRGGEWKLLRPLELPVVPVPVGTGLSRDAGSRSPFAVLDESVRLSILVGTDSVWIGLSRVNETTKIDAKDAPAIEAALKAHKESAFFADRADIEIAGDDNLPYSKVVAMIDLVDLLGFTKWTIRAPTALSSRFTQ